MSLQYIQKHSPRLLHTPAKFEKNPPSGARVMRKIKCEAGRAAGAGGARYPPIHKQASLVGRLIKHLRFTDQKSAPSDSHTGQMGLQVSLNQTRKMFLLTKTKRP